MKKNKTISTIMAATVVASSVVPAFAAEVQSLESKAEVKSSVQIGTINTKIIDVRTAYGEALTKDSEGNIVKEPVEGAKVILAKAVLDKTVAELEAMAKETYQTIEDNQIVVKSRYTLAVNEEKTSYRYSINEEDKIVDNQIFVEVTNNETGKTVNYIFVGIKGFDLDLGFGQELPVKVKTLDLSDADQYESMTRIQYELEKNANLVKVEKEKKSDEDGMGYDLVLTVKLTDGTKVAKITLENVQDLDKDVYVSLPVGGDIEGHWAEKFVLDAMIDKWVDASAEFRPNDAITRAEFVKVVNRAFGVNAKDMSLTQDFSDVSTSAWYYQDIKAAARLGYIEGYEDGTFRPNQPITRQEAAKIIAKLHANIGLADGEEMADVEIVVPDINGNNVHKDTKTSFKDDESIAVWADESVKYLKDADIINGYEDNTFKPGNDIKRAEAITMLTRAVK